MFYWFNFDFSYFDLLLSLFLLLFFFLLLSPLFLLLLSLLLLLYCYYFSIINVIHFILFHFIFYCSYYYDFCLRFCVTCVCVSPRVFLFVCFFFVCLFYVNNPKYILTLLIYFKHIIHVIITLIFFFFNTTSHWGRIQQMNLSSMVSAPTHWLLWVSHRVSIIINFFSFSFCKLFFGDHSWGVDALFFHIYHMTSFNYDAKEARDVGLSCRCHLSNSQIVSSV